METRNIVIDATANVGGGGVYIRELLPRLSTLLPDYQFVICGDHDPFPHGGGPNIEFRRARVPIPVHSIVWPGIAKLAWRLFVLPWRALAMRPTVMVTTSNVISPIFRFASVPTVVCLHNLTPFHSPEWYRETTFGTQLRNRALRSLTSLSIKTANTTIAFSEYAKKLITARRSSDRSEVALIPHGSPEKKAAWRGQESDTFLIVAHYHPYKRIEVVIQAFRELRNRGVCLSARLLVQGHVYNGPYYEQMQRLVQTLGLQDCVELGTGISGSELEETLSTARALIFPSIGENCPITLMEAMSSGLPVIAADCEPCPEICGEGAIYFSEGNATSCAQQIEYLFDNPEVALLLSRAGSAQVKQFTWDKAARDTAAVIQRLATAHA